MPRTLTVGLLGCGVVGTGVVALLDRHASSIASRVGAPVRLGPVAVRDPRRSRGVEVATLVDDPRKALSDPDVDIVVELIGGQEPAASLIREALEAGKHVVTANKAVVARDGAALAALAARQGVTLQYEAAVAGAIPLLRPIRESLAGDRVRKIMGILNGTTNYVLTRMSESGASLADALAEAQRAGYAEADPSADVSGADAAAKAAILAGLAFDAQIDLEHVHTEGIERVSATDIVHARRMGYVIKLLGIAEEIDEALSVRVHPALLPSTHPLAGVREAANAVFVRADAAGELTFQGQGAGSLPTASAVVGDVVSAARAILAGGVTTAVAAPSRRPLLPFAEARTQAYLLLDVTDAPGVLAGVAAVFGQHDVSIRSVWQEGVGDRAQLVLITHAAPERALQATLEQLDTLPAVRAVASMIRVEGSEV